MTLDVHRFVLGLDAVNVSPTPAAFPISRLHLSAKPVIQYNRRSEEACLGTHCAATQFRFCPSWHCGLYKMDTCRKDHARFRLLGFLRKYVDVHDNGFLMHVYRFNFPEESTDVQRVVVCSIGCLVERWP